ncbi:unnamed protein product [Urochloa humidicola]
MANSSRLEQLGLPAYFPNGQRTATNSKDKNKTNERNREDADYDPLHDYTGEQDLFDDDIAKGSKGKTSKKNKKQPSDASHVGVKFRSRKRVYASGTPTTGPMPNRSISQPDASLAPSDIHELPPSHPAVSDLIGPGEQGEHVPWNRGTNMGHGLNRMNRAHRGKLPIIIPKGQIRPMVPLIAAKYATEINIAVRNHVPVLTHWNQYKARPTVIEGFLRTLRAKFNIDTNDEVVKNGCLEMMKIAVRNQRHRVKKDFF